MSRLTLIFLSALFLNVSLYAGDGAGLPSLSKCKDYMDNIVEVFHQELTGANASVISTRDLRVVVNTRWVSIEGTSVLDDGYKYYTKITPKKNSCFLSNFKPVK